MADVLPRLEAGDEDPACEVCGGILKSATVSFGQSLDQAVLDAAVAATHAADLFLAIGTSLQVYPAAGLCDLALARRHPPGHPQRRAHAVRRRGDGRPHHPDRGTTLPALVT